LRKLRYFPLLPLSIGMTLLAYLLAPVTALFVRKDGTLPYPLSYLGTTDNPNWGDQGHEERWNYAHSYLQALSWLYRNPAYSFEWDGPLAATINSYDKVSFTGNPWIKNRANAVAGSYFCTVGNYWNFKVIKPLFGDLAFMGEWGWKLQGYAQGRETEGKAMYVFSIRLTAFNP
jgi:hypothetical protein